MEIADSSFSYTSMFSNTFEYLRLVGQFFVRDVFYQTNVIITNIIIKIPAQNGDSSKTNPSRLFFSLILVKAITRRRIIRKL